MVASKVYENYFGDIGSAVRKEALPKIETKRVQEKKTKLLRKNKMALVPFILGIFAMTLILSFRYSIINEKNIETINLKSDLEKTESAVFATKIAVEQETDLEAIEAYAKQQLGMQKPTKNQIIYVDTSENIGTIEQAESTGLFSDVKSNILNFINNIF